MTIDSSDISINFASKIRFSVKKIILLVCAVVMLCSSCGEYNKLLKSQDVDLKYSYAKKYFNQKKYVRSAALLEDIIQYFRGRSEAEELLYLLAQSYYGQKDYGTASTYFQAYASSFPKGEFVELAKYYSAYCLYLDSPDPRLDQSQTYGSINQFLLFIEEFPQSERAKEAQEILFELQEKLAYKEYRAAKLYYDLGTYLGNNYRACVITAENALLSYPDSKYREELVYLKIRSKHELALASVEELLQGRYRDVVDEYYNYINEFPEGKYTRQVKRFFDYANSKIIRLF